MPLLEVQDVEAGYGPLVVLQDMSVRVASGERVLVIGRNGSGKSTLLKAIFGLVPVRSGRVVLDGTDLTRLSSARRVRHGIALVPQTGNEGRGVFDRLTVEQNLALGAFSLGPRAQREASAARDGVYDLFPDLKLLARRRAGLLSGGQQQMLAIGIALMSRPKILMLDEPTSGLSAKLSHLVAAKLGHIVEETGIGLVVVEQNIRVMTGIASRVYACRNGAIAREGSVEEVIERGNILEVL